jgi:hypothetical protein
MIPLGQEMQCQVTGCSNRFIKTNYTCKYCGSCAEKIKKERRKEDRKEGSEEGAENLFRLQQAYDPREVLR